MNKEKRLRSIVEIISKKESIKVSELAKLFSVSEMTINRDLRLLDSKGFLQKVYGGAVKDTLGINVVPYPVRMKKNSIEKGKIGERAIKYIKEGKIYFVGGGSTLATFASKWPEKIKSILLTNSVLIPIMVNNLENLEVHSSGGILLKEYLTLVGPLAEQTIGNYNIDTAFLCCFGMSSSLNIYEADIYQASLLKKVYSVSKKVILLVDHSKFGVETKYKSLDIEDIDIIITSKKIPETFLENIFKKNIKVVLV
ncbi:HTH-type transcriptional repressor GlcR [subsurface metagenome]